MPTDRLIEQRIKEKSMQASKEGSEDGGLGESISKERHTRDRKPHMGESKHISLKSQSVYHVLRKKDAKLCKEFVAMLREYSKKISLTKIGRAHV